MKSLYFSLALITVLLLSSCSYAPLEGENIATLPGPIVRMNRPTETPNLFPTISTSEPISEPNNDISNSGSQTPVPRMAFGTESHTMDFQSHTDIIGETGLQLVRHNALLWYNVEPSEGERQWEAIAELEDKLARASSSGLSTILIVRGTPEWAQMIPGSFCGPIRQDRLDAFANFLSEAVKRYSIPPYNVKYWELGNEPDVDPSLVSPNSVFGCWGDQNDPYYGGGYYAEMLKSVYPAIKSADPEAKVLIGGLLLDCDPTQPPEGKDCKPGNFLEGILRNGGGDFFDAVSFHGYAAYIGPTSGIPNELFFDDHHPSWEHRGGVVIGKVDFLRQVMAAFNLDKPIFHTEGALLCSEHNPTDCDPPGEDFYDSQADYVVRMYVRNWVNGVSGTIWYQFEGPGWRYGGLLDENQNPKPAYDALRFLITELSDAEFSGVLAQFDALAGYEFISPEKRIWVLWSPDEIDAQIQLPENVLSVFDKFGNDITPDGADITVSNPIYLELHP
jgi:hypothetical protein